MPLPTVLGREHSVRLSVRLSVHLLVPILHDKIALKLLEVFQYKLAQIFTTYVSIAEKVFKVRGQRSAS